MNYINRGRYFHGSAVDRALLVKRRSPLWARKGVVFIHVPKAAGTSISEALYGRFTGHVRAADVLRWASSRVRSLPKVAVVRNPWSRLVSAYRFVRRGAGIGGPNAGRVWNAEQYDIPEFATFESFVNDWLAGQDLSRLDEAFQPQSPFVCNHRGEVIVDHLGRVELLDETRRYLEDHVHALGPIGRSNRSGDPLDYRSFYTPNLIDRVAEMYADDVRILGYEFED
jgi:hypothetical protein